MHRCYQPILPSHNKLLQKRWDSNYYDEHKKKIHEARPMVDTRPPQTYMHLHLKLKKLQLEEERLSTVERDNRILLEKMSHIMRTKGRVNNKNNYEYKSLNREKRMRELLRVTQENQEILHRITQRKPLYDHTKWERDWEENQRYMDSIAAYPRDWWKDQREDSTMSSSGQHSARSQKSARGQKKEKKEKREKKEHRDNRDKKKNQEQTDEQSKEEEQQEN